VHEIRNKIALPIEPSCVLLACKRKREQMVASDSVAKRPKYSTVEATLSPAHGSLSVLNRYLDDREYLEALMFYKSLEAKKQQSPDMLEFRVLQSGSIEFRVLDGAAKTYTLSYNAQRTSWHVRFAVPNLAADELPPLNTPTLQIVDG
jgi:hypothetical protein